MIGVSLNEVDYSVKRAARGAGMAWGLAEEAGFSARWLAARRLPCLAAFACLFEAQDGMAYEELKPSEDWRAARGSLCPIASGAALSDLGIANDVKSLGPMRQPLLFLPQIARAALGVATLVAWEGTRVVLGDGELEVIDGATLYAASVESCTIERSGRTVKANPAAAHGGINVEDSVWARLQAFVWRTYVPQSEASRLKGAGAGLTDND